VLPEALSRCPRPGARKRRFAGRGKGKSGGYRIVSYYADDDVPVLMLALIKGERDNLLQAERNELRKELAGYAQDYRADCPAWYLGHHHRFRSKSDRG
jgi:hypothetical protein